MTYLCDENTLKNLAAVLKREKVALDNNSINDYLVNKQCLHDLIYTYLHERSGVKTTEFMDQPGYEDMLSDISFYMEEGV